MAMRILFLFIFFGFSVSLFADSTYTWKQRKEIKSKRRMKIMQEDPLWLGVEVARPQFNYGMKADGPWFGPSLMIMGGIMNINLLRGIASVFDADSGKTYRSRGSIVQTGFQIPLYSMANRNFELSPQIGLGLTFQMLADKRKENTENEDWDPLLMGGYLRPGLVVKAGPIIGTIQYNLNLGYNITEKNAFSFTNHYPSIGLYCSAMPVLMNPRDFTANGIRHYRDLVDVRQEKSGLSYWKEVDRNTDYIKYKKQDIYWVKSTYSDRYENESIRCNDVKPYTYLGPRISSTWFMKNTLEQGTMVGLQAGFRYSLWAVNIFAEQGDIILPSPEKEISLQATYRSRAVPILSGKFSGSRRMGAQAGIELLVKAQKSNFKANYQTRDRVSAMTGFVGIVPYVGFGQLSLGSFGWQTTTGSQDAAAYEELTGKTVYKEGSVAKTQKFWSLGCHVHLGALNFGLEWNFHPDAHRLDSRQLFVALNLPVARIIRSVFVKGYIKKIKSLPDSEL